MDTNEAYWEKQYQDYLDQPYPPERRYASWQPGRWAANGGAVLRLAPYLAGVSLSCEVGAGSAAFSFALKQRLGIGIMGVDLCANAEKYALRIAEDMHLPIDYRREDLFGTQVRAELVLSLGVIEHYDREKQLRFLEKCRDISQRYVLTAIPNQDSAIFRNYVRWANRGARSYEEEHRPLTTEELGRMCEAAGLRVVLADGFQVFLSELDFWNETDLDEIPLYRRLQEEFRRREDRWKAFPYMSFTYEDIPTMIRTENALSAAERLQNGFMTFVLAEKAG